MHAPVNWAYSADDQVICVQEVGLNASSLHVRPDKLFSGRVLIEQRDALVVLATDGISVSVHRYIILSLPEAHWSRGCMEPNPFKGPHEHL